MGFSNVIKARRSTSGPSELGLQMSYFSRLIPSRSEPRDHAHDTAQLGMDAKHRRLECLSCRVKRLLALRRDEELNQPPSGDWRQHPHAKRRRILRQIQQQGSNESIRQIIRHVDVVALDVYLPTLVLRAAGCYARGSFYCKVNRLHKERPILNVMVAY